MRARKFAAEPKEEVVANVTNVSKMVNCEVENLDVMVIEGGNDFKPDGVISIPTKLCLCFLFVPEMSGNLLVEEAATTRK